MLPPGGGVDGGGNKFDLAGVGNQKDGGGPVVGPDMAGFNMAGSPVVTIVSPAANTEIAGNTLTVTATVTSPTNTLIASSSVTVSIQLPNKSVVQVQLLPSGVANTYTGSVDITAIPSGAATFTVSATDVNNLGGSTVGNYVHDPGPQIRFIKPKNAAYKGVVDIEIQFDDALHPITMLSQVKAGIRSDHDIPIVQKPNTLPFTVVASIDVTTFTPPLDGPQIITAQATADTATAAKLTVRQTQSFQVDNTGPVIVFKSPDPAKTPIFGGILNVEVDVQDTPAGVDPTSVIAILGGNSANLVHLTRETDTGTLYSGIFDLRALSKENFVQPELSVRAQDLLGNESEIGIQVIIDTTRPWLNMNAAFRMRLSQVDQNSPPLLECSRPFSPLGPTKVPDGVTEAISEGDSVLRMMNVRARVEDRGNRAPGLTVERFSGIDANNVTLFVIPKTTQPLAVDTDSDGLCDEVNPLLVPTTDTVNSSNEALALKMVTVVNPGAADFRPLTSGFVKVDGVCDENGDPNATKAPPPLCTNAGTGLTVNLPWVDPNHVGAIWTLPVANSDSDKCVGFQLDSLNHGLVGPVCAIVRAVDNAGNVNVSYPLHICILDSTGTNCNSFAFNKTDCTGVWDKVQQKMLSGTCAEPSSTPGDPNQGTFPQDGSEVRLRTIGQ